MSNNPNPHDAATALKDAIDEAIARLIALRLEGIWTPASSREWADFAEDLRKRINVATDISAELVGDIARLYDHVGGGLDTAAIKQDVRDVVSDLIDDTAPDADDIREQNGEPERQATRCWRDDARFAEPA